MSRDTSSGDTADPCRSLPTGSTLWHRRETAASSPIAHNAHRRRLLLQLVRAPQLAACSTARAVAVRAGGRHRGASAGAAVSLAAIWVDADVRLDQVHPTLAQRIDEVELGLPARRGLAQQFGRHRTRAASGPRHTSLRCGESRRTAHKSAPMLRRSLLAVSLAAIGLAHLLKQRGHVFASHDSRSRPWTRQARRCEPNQKVSSVPRHLSPPWNSRTATAAPPGLPRLAARKRG